MIQNRMKYKHSIHYIIFLLPCVLLFLFFYAYPTITVIATCMTDWKLGKGIHFNGFDNFIQLFRNKTVLIAMKNTIAWLVINCIVGIGIALIVAIIVRKRTMFNNMVKVIYLIPNMISISVIGFIYYFIFNPSVGPVNSFINIFTDNFKLNWYQDAHTAFLTVTLTTIFYGGMSTLLLSSEIATIPEEVMESAQIDGATEMQINIWIILPMIKNIIGTTLILATVNTLKSFEVIYLTTNGGPGNITMNLPVTIYRTAMMNNTYGYSNAISVITILIGGVAILIINRLFMTERSVHKRRRRG